MKLELDKAREDGREKLGDVIRNASVSTMAAQFDAWLADLQAKTLEIAAKLKPNDLMLPQDVEQAHAYCVGFSDALQAIAAAAAALREGR